MQLCILIHIIQLAGLWFDSPAPPTPRLQFAFGQCSATLSAHRKETHTKLQLFNL